MTRSAESEAALVDPGRYRRVISRFATGVAVVAAREGEAIRGMTVNSLTSVSLDPPMLLVCLTIGSRTTGVLARVGCRFGVSILSEAQKNLADAFAVRDAERQAPLQIDDPPVIARCAAWLVCTTCEVHEVADHLVVFGRVDSASRGVGDPLVFFEGRYARHIDFDDYPVTNWWS